MERGSEGNGETKGLEKEIERERRRERNGRMFRGEGKEWENVKGGRKGRGKGIDKGNRR